MIVTIALCLAGSFKLFASASAASGGGHAASIGRWPGGKLIPPTGRHPHTPLHQRRQQVAGQSVTAVGDSVMVASTPALQHALPGIYIDAAASSAPDCRSLLTLRQGDCSAPSR